MKEGLAQTRGPKDHINTRSLQTMISGIPLMLGLGTGISNPHVYAVFGACRAAELSLFQPGVKPGMKVVRLDHV